MSKLAGAGVAQLWTDAVSLCRFRVVSRAMPFKGDLRFNTLWEELGL